MQSVALRLIVEKEREIKAFVPEEYWDIHADTQTPTREALRLQVTSQQGKTFDPKNEQQAMAAVQTLKNAAYTVRDREDKPTSSKPSAPFITSTLQQAASTRLSFGVKKTMMMAQRLYEAGHITYMRTDSTNLSQEAVVAVRDYIEQQFGKKYLPKDPLTYGSKANAQEAHEAIRPSNVEVKADALKDMEADAVRLYDLIWRQFVACQMTPAQYDTSTLTVTAADFELKAKGRILRFAGWTKALPPMGRKGDDIELPAVNAGDVLQLVKLDPKQHFTKPPARFTEAALVKELEKRGIGRPSTYASIISTIQDRGYVKVEARRFYAEKMGEIVTDRLVESFTDLMSYDFTAQMESSLDNIAQGNLDWHKQLDSFYSEFKADLQKAEGDMGGMRSNQVVLTDIDCPTCGRKMGIRTASTGVFLGCSGYALPPKERCKGTKNLMPVEAFASQTAKESQNQGDEESDNHDEIQALLEKKRCPKCHTAMDGYIVDGGLKLHVCGNNPDCDGYLLEKGVFETANNNDMPTIPCDKCDGEMALKTGRFGAYFACQKCDNTRKVLKNGEAAPPRMTPIAMPQLRSQRHDDHYILREGAAGLFLAASKFPKVRETRPPKLAELRAIQDQLESKFHYLLTAPDKDPDGNPTILRWSRKNAEQYVGSEKDGKATKFALVYRHNQWVEQ